MPMPFPQTSLKDVGEQFHLMKKITLTTLIGAFLLNGLLVGYILFRQEISGEKVYVATPYGTFSALLQQTREVSVFEASNQVKAFLLSAFAHSAASYKSQMEKALQLVDKAGGARLVHDFNKGEVYQNYVRLGTYTTLEVDSVFINEQTLPLSGKAYARQKIHLDSEEKVFPLAIQFELIPTARSEENPFGLLLQQLDFIPYLPPSNQ